jgi:predicted nucleic acid-binding protein
VGLPFVLDTGGLIDYEAVDLGGWASGTVLVSAVTVGELAYGVDVGDAEQRARRRDRLRTVLLDYEVLPFGVEEAKLYGALATLVRASGRNPRPRRLDLQIAATAAAARLPLLTTNPDDFAGTEALVEVVGLRRA